MQGAYKRRKRHSATPDDSIRSIVTVNVEVFLHAIVCHCHFVLTVL